MNALKTVLAALVSAALVSAALLIVHTVPDEWPQGPDQYDLLRYNEGESLTVYVDTGGVPTVCVGHTGPDVSVSDLRRSQAECDELLEADLYWVDVAINDLIHVPLNAQQYKALQSFVFNIGRTQFRQSSLREALNSGDYEAVPYQLRRWVYDNGVVIDGLVARREREVSVWLTGSFYR